MTLDFARYLSIWMFDCHQDERVFWSTMNPARLHTLYNSYFALPRHSADFGTAKQQKRPERSLSEFLMGGG